MKRNDSFRLARLIQALYVFFAPPSITRFDTLIWHIFGRIPNLVHNDENTLVIHDANLALAYYAEWQTLWNAIDAEDKCNPFSIYMPVTIK
jgi:hypothetical protein